VSEVGSISDVPLEGFGTGCSVVFREKQPYSADEKTPCVSTPIATPGVFAALRIAIEGRAPTWGDVETRTQAVVVTRALANRLWPGENPIGKGINSNGPDAPRWYRVVGVAADIKAEALDAPNSEAVFYAATTLGDDDDSDGLTDHAYLVRTSGIDPLSLLPSVRQTLSTMNSRVPIIAPRTMDSVLKRSMARTTFVMILLAISAGVALLLSAVGIYGVISYIVTQRREEIGIRMALGANVNQVVRLVMLQSVRLAVVGVAIGLAGALAFSRTMQSVLFGVNPADPLVMLAVVVLLLGTTVAASLFPARRAARVDPSEAMRAG
jgi:hypothetical protein